METLPLLTVTTLALVGTSSGGEILSSAECPIGPSANYSLSSLSSSSLYPLSNSISSSSSSLLSSALSSTNPNMQERKKGLEKLREELKDRRFASVDAKTMKEWLIADLGSTFDTAYPEFQKLWTEAPSQTSNDGETVYERKKVFHSLYDMNVNLSEASQQPKPRRKTNHIFTDAIGVLRQIYLIHNTTSTSGKASPHYTRLYPALPFKWDQNLIVGTVRRLFAELFAPSNQDRLEIEAPFGTDMFQFCYRTLISKQNGGDPGPEGAHVDGGTAAMILVVKRENIRPGTGGTRIWSMQQKTGKPTSEDIQSDKVLYTWRPSSPFEALFFLDESVLHEALKGELIDEEREATRDMLIMDLRRQDRSWRGRGQVIKG